MYDLLSYYIDVSGLSLKELAKFVFRHSQPKPRLQITWCGEVIMPAHAPAKEEGRAYTSNEPMDEYLTEVYYALMNYPKQVGIELLTNLTEYDLILFINSL